MSLQKEVFSSWGNAIQGIFVTWGNDSSVSNGAATGDMSIALDLRLYGMMDFLSSENFAASGDTLLAYFLI